MKWVYLISNLKICLKKKKLVLLQKRSKMVIQVLNALWDEKLILGYKVLNKNFVKIYLKFDNSGNPVIKDFFLISTFSRKRYMRVSDIKSNNIQKNYFFFLNTSKGILSHEKALIKKVGGEVFFKICV